MVLIHIHLLCEHRLPIFLGIYLRVKLLGCIAILFNFLRICQPVSKATAPLLLSHPQCLKVPVSQYLPLPVFTVVAILVGILV